MMPRTVLTPAAPVSVGPARASVLSADRQLSPVRERRWRVMRTAVATRGALAGGAVLALAVLAAVFAPAVSPYDPLKQDLTRLLAPPGPAHLLGTDNIGRDVLTRVIWGTRVSLIAGFVAVAMAVAVGSLLGLVAGYRGGRIDGFIMRLMDAVLSFPALVLALALGAVLGAGLGGVLIALGVVLHANVCTADARTGAHDPHPRVCCRGAVAWRAGLAHCSHARAAERRYADRGAGVAERGVRHSGRSVAVVPRTRRAAA